MTYSFTDFLHDIDAELLARVGKTTTDFPDYEFEADFNTGWTVALSATEAIIQHGSISEVAKVDPDNICLFSSPFSDESSSGRSLWWMTRLRQFCKISFQAIAP